MRKYAYFLGCITANRYPSIELATRSVLKKLGIELLEMKGASCCPAPGVIGSFDLWTWIIVAARNLCIAEEMSTDIVVTCNGCYATLSEVSRLLNDNAKLREKVNDVLRAIGREYKNTVKVKHVIDVLHDDIGYENIQKNITRPLRGINVAVHYGCHLLRPSKVRGHGSAERPTFIDELVEVLDAKSISYQRKLMCCGAGGGVRSGNLELALKYTQEKLENMIVAGADCVVTPCAFCHLQFDYGQTELVGKTGKEYHLPVVFITQLLGLALGLSLNEVGLHINKTNVRRIQEKLS